jgi:hypothetical protein
MKNKYYVIEFEDHQMEKPLEPIGPFASEKECEDWIRKNSMEIVSNGKELLSDEDCESWAPPSHIVKLVSSVRPVPSIKIDMRLKRIEN